MAVKCGWMKEEEAARGGEGGQTKRTICAVAADCNSSMLCCGGMDGWDGGTIAIQEEIPVVVYNFALKSTI